MDAAQIKIFLYGSGDGDGSGYGSGDGNGYGYGYGNGSGYGDGNGSGSGYGSGSGSGDGDGSGYGSGSGDGSGYGSGNGYGNGSGSGNGYGNGSGSGYGSGSGFLIHNYKNNNVYYIDNIPCIFKNIKNNVAKVSVINHNDFTLKDGYVAKGNEFFAHGLNIKEAIIALQQKIYANLNFDEKIKEFKAKFNKKKKYLGQDFFIWHGLLTGSCQFGRNEFITNNNIDLKNKYTVDEFLNIAKNQYGWNKLKDLEQP